MSSRSGQILAVIVFAFFWAGVCSAEDILVTRHFTGAWDQVEQESQGLSLEVIEQLDDSRLAVAYWYTYGPDRKSAWYVGSGPITGNRIDLDLFISDDLGFMQAARPGNESVTSIGTMTITFDDCDHGDVIFETGHADVGSGSFEIARLTDIMNTHCSGGISDNMHADARHGSQRLQLHAARDGISGFCHASYEDSPGHTELEVECEGLPDGQYHLYSGMADRGEFSVHGGFGEIEFHSPGEFGKHLMTFEPYGRQIEVRDNMGVVVSSFDGMFNHDDHHQDNDDHSYHCGMGGGMGGGMGHGPGGGMHDCVNEGEMLEIEVDLINTGVIASAEGDAEWEMTPNRVEFNVEIEDVPVGTYSLLVGQAHVGQIEAIDFDGDVSGEIEFRDPQAYGKEHLDFDPRGQNVQVQQDGTTILEVDFPEE